MNKRHLLYRIKRRLCKLFLSPLEYMKWEDNESFKKLVLEKYYRYTDSIVNKTTQSTQTIIYVADGTFPAGGLADRLKGVISTYKYARDNNLNFSIQWTWPFPLSDYLLPNKVNWLCKGLEKELPSCKPIFIGSYYKRLNIEKTSEEYMQYKYLEDTIKRKGKRTREFHIYSNAHFGEENFNELFHCLFKVNPRIESLVQVCLEEMNNKDYIAASFRFRQLLGDFTDACGGGTLSKRQQELLIGDSLFQLRKLHEQNSSCVILVTSDSTLFNRLASELKFVYIAPGDISHIDAKNTSSLSNDKEFLDLFLLSRAKQIFVFHHEGMHYSGFPTIAAKIENKPIQIIEY